MTKWQVFLMALVVGGAAGWVVREGSMVAKSAEWWAWKALAVLVLLPGALVLGAVLVMVIWRSVWYAITGREWS